MTFPGGSAGKESTCNAGDSSLIPGMGRSPGGGHGNPLEYSCWRIPWTKEPDELQSIGLQRVGHDWTTKYSAGHSYRCRIVLKNTYAKLHEDWKSDNKAVCVCGHVCMPTNVSTCVYIQTQNSINSNITYISYKKLIKYTYNIHAINMIYIFIARL